MNRLQVRTPYQPAGDQPQAIRKLVEGLKNKYRYQTLLGVTGSGKTYTIANVIEKTQRPALVLAPNKTLAAQLYGEFREMFPANAVEYFVSYYDYYQPEAYVPTSGTYIEKDASINDHIEQMRLSCTKSLLEQKDFIIVATVSAIYGLGAPESYLKMVLHLKRNMQMDMRAMFLRLADMQYRRNDVDFSRGVFRVRGDIVDIYPAESDKEALRVEIFEDRIENLVLFDPLTGEIKGKVPRYTVYPKSHYVTPRRAMMAAVDKIRVELAEQLKKLKASNHLVELQRLEQRTNYDLEMIQELGYCTGIENYSRHLSGRAEGEPPPTLFDYVPREAILVVDESHVTVPQLGGMYLGDRSRKRTLVEYGFRLPSALDNRPLMFAEWEAHELDTIFVSATPADYEAKHSVQVVEQLIRPTGVVDPRVEVRAAHNQVEDLFDEIKRTVPKGRRVLVTVLTKKFAENLTDYFYEKDIKVRYLHSDIDTIERVEIIRDLRLGVFDVLIGINLLREGLDMPEVELVAILDADKEGFLRSTRSLVQTIGRAARNVAGRAILYADSRTNSMTKAIEETGRRRTKQMDFNKKHNFRPQSIKKGVTDIMEGAIHAQKKEKVAALEGDLTALTFPQLIKETNKLEKKMRQAAQDLRFEDAVLLRDRLEECRQQTLYVRAGKG